MKGVMTLLRQMKRVKVAIIVYNQQRKRIKKILKELVIIKDKKEVDDINEECNMKIKQIKDLDKIEI